MKLVSIVLLLLIGASGLLAEPGRPRVLATTGMISDVVRNVGGDLIEVETLIGPGVDPHLFKATRSDIASLIRSDVIFYNGLLLEGKITDVLARVATAGKMVHAVTSLIDQSYLLAPEQFQGHFDPHVWMDPGAWSKTVEVVAEKLSEFSPAMTQSFRNNAAAFAIELAELDNYCKRVLESVPSESRVLVTAHDAFNYFGKRYGYEVLGIQGLSTESEAGVQDIERLVRTLVERRVKAVFVESTVSSRNVQALIDGARARQHEVIIGGQLFSDAMGKPDTYEGTYIGMIDHNVTTIARALGGKAERGGMKGLLKDR